MAVESSSNERVSSAGTHSSGTLHHSVRFRQSPFIILSSQFSRQAVRKHRPSVEYSSLMTTRQLLVRLSIKYSNGTRIVLRSPPY